MGQSTRIAFVTWPDGKVDGQSLTLADKRIAIERFIASYLPVEWFGAYPISYVADTLWRGARKNGFRVHLVEIGPDGAPKLVEE